MNNITRKHLQQGQVAIYLVMLIASVVVTLGVALVLYPGGQRPSSFVLSLVMLCFAEIVLFGFPIYHTRPSANGAEPAFTFGLGFQAALGVYATGVILLCFLAGSEAVSFRALSILHTVWALGLLLVSGLWRLGSSSATQTATSLKTQKQRFAEVKVRLDSFASSVTRDRDPQMQPFVQSVKALKDDVTYATPESLPGTESYDASLLSALERLGADYNSARTRSDAADANPLHILDLVDKARALSAMVRERNAAIRAAR